MKKLTVLIAIFLSIVLSLSHAQADVVEITDGQYYQHYNLAFGTLNMLGGSFENLIRESASSA